MTFKGVCNSGYVLPGRGKLSKPVVHVVLVVNGAHRRGNLCYSAQRIALVVDIDTPTVPTLFILFNLKWYFSLPAVLCDFLLNLFPFYCRQWLDFMR